MKSEDIKERLHHAMHRSPQASEDELAAVTALVLAVVGEVTAELAEIIGHLSARVDALEHKAA